MRDGVLMQECDVEVEPGLWRPVVLHVDCVVQITTNPEAYARLIENIDADYDLYKHVMAHRIVPFRTPRPDDS